MTNRTILLKTENSRSVRFAFPANGHDEKAVVCNKSSNQPHENHFLGERAVQFSAKPFRIKNSLLITCVQQEIR